MLPTILNLCLFDLHPFFQGNIYGIQQGLVVPSIAVFSEKCSAMILKKKCYNED